MKRPALRAGVKCGDATALSCYTFEPPALPLLWAFCRSPARQNRALSGAECVTGRLGVFPASRCFFCDAHEISRGKTVSCDNGSKTLQHWVSISRRCTDATQTTGVPQTGLQCETGAFIGSWRGSSWNRQLLAEKNLPLKYAAAPMVFETFWERCPMDKGPL